MAIIIIKEDNMKKKAVSPIITTILLILLAIVLASIIFLYFRNFVKEVPTKFSPTANQDRPITELCAAVRLEASIDGNNVAITNLGAIPLSKIELLVSFGGSSERKEYELGINSGESKIVTSSVPLGSNSVKLIPILLGKMKSGEVNPYSCLDNALVLQ
jgi:flagellin-like protein